MTETSTVVVRSLVREAEDVLGLTLARPDGAPLPEWVPGAHIDLVLTPELVRQYSLCGDPSDRSQYQIAVLREAASRGGSEYVHAELKEGDEVGLRGPRNHFELLEAPWYLFIAGGIGVTPILPMVEQVAKSDSEFSILYGGRRKASMAFTDRLGRYGSKVQFVPQDVEGLLDLKVALGNLAPDGKVYCCGPEALISAVEELCVSLDPDVLHVERFAVRQIDESTIAGQRSVRVVLDRSGKVLTVPPDRSILDVVLEAGLDVPYDCSEGICGSCEVKVLDGDIEHRDEVLTKFEQESNTAMMICCSRARGERIVLDL
jgi:ferredoxin-NADP reductase